MATIDLPDGTYSYSVTAAGYQAASGDVTVSGADITENVSLSPMEYTVTFIVADMSTFDPIENAEIYINGQIILTNTNGEAFIELTDGTYDYTVIASDYVTVNDDVLVNGSDLTEEVLMDLETGVNNALENRSMIKIYPNPADDLIRIKLNRRVSHMIVRILSMEGVIVMADELYGVKLYEADLRNMAKGTYFIEIIVDRKIYREKIILK